jgi:hypothetical protein
MMPSSGFLVGVSLFVIGVFGFWVEFQKRTTNKPLKILSWIARILIIAQWLFFISFVWGMRTQRLSMPDVMWIMLGAGGMFIVGRRLEAFGEQQ